MFIAQSFVKPILRPIVIASITMTACKASSEKIESRSDMAFVEAADTEMYEAMVHARETFPEFWKAKSKSDPEYSDFNVKIGLPDSGGSIEHIWVTNVERKDNEFTGKLINEPFRLPNYKNGDEVTFTTNQVSDWQYLIDGRSEGNFTTRVILKTMPKEKASEIRAILGWEE